MGNWFGRWFGRWMGETTPPPDPNADLIMLAHARDVLRSEAQHLRGHAEMLKELADEIEEYLE